MERKEFQDRLLTATDRAVSLAGECVINYLPAEVRYRVLLNSSFDGNPLAGDEQVFPQEESSVHDGHVPVANVEQVTCMLWRNGKVPEWIDVNVECTDEQWTYINLRCCGRFTALDDFLCHRKEGHPPFHAQSPPIPPGAWEKRKPEKFDLLWRRRKMEQDRASLYPDVIEHGSVGRLLNSQLGHIGSALKVRGFEEGGGSPWGARAENNRRVVDLASAPNGRRFIAGLWDRGVELGTLQTGDVTQLVESIQAWCVDGRSVGNLAGISPQIEFATDWVAAFEAGPEAFTRRRWQSLLKAAVDYPQNETLSPVVREASKTPELNRLWPFTSMRRLGFSRCTGYPFSGDCPLIAPVAGEKYQVIGGSGEVVGHGDVQEAVALAVRHLPPGCGSAIHGTASDLTNSRPTR